MTKTNFEVWFDLFRKAWNVRMIENEHLLKIAFLEFLSTLNRVRYVYAGRYRNINLSSFKVQQSGTGKGVADELVHDILRHLGCKVSYVNTFTEAGIVGSLYYNKAGKPEVVKGELGDCDFIWVDEARSLIVGNSWSAGLMETINGYLETGEVAKRLAQGTIRYYSNCVFGTGTFFFEKLKPTAIQAGLFQRCLFSYKNYTNDDVLRISGKFDELSERDYIIDLKPIFDEFKDRNYKMDFKRYKHYDKMYIKMSSEASKKLGQKIDRFYKNEIIGGFKEQRLMDIMNSFLIRSKVIGQKVLALQSIWNDEEEITDNGVEFAYEVVKDQLLFAREFISDVFETTRFDDEELLSFRDKKQKNIKTRQVILKILGENPGMTKTEFREFVQNNRKKFAWGELTIVQKILPYLIEEGIIKEEVGDKGEKKLFVA